MAVDEAVDLREVKNAAAIDAADALLEAEKTTRGLHRMVWKLAWPSVLTMMLQSANAFTDRFFVGKLGPDALAAVGLGGQFMFLLFSVGISISIGTTALVARFTGARQPESATMAANQSVMIGTVASLICAVVMLPLSAGVVLSMGMDAHATSLCSRYLTITILGVPALFLMLILSGVYRGLGDMVTPLRVMILVNVVHLGGDYLLIFGHGGLPQLGLSGGAVALTISQVVGAAFYLWFLRRTPVRGLLRASRRLNLEWTKRILRIGVPAGLQNVSRVLSSLAFTNILAHTPQGTEAIAALTIGLTSESIAFMPGIGFSTAASTLTGQNLGAREPEKAGRAAWAALLQGLAIMTSMGVVFYVFAPHFTAIFTQDLRVERLGVAYLRTMALSEPFLALGMILTGALNGAGETRPPAWASVVCMWMVRLPAAWFLAHWLGLGAVSGWWAMAGSTIMNGVWVLVLFRSGRWKQARV